MGSIIDQWKLTPINRLTIDSRRRRRQPVQLVGASRQLKVTIG
jgi:hypothetical protein